MDEDELDNKGGEDLFKELLRRLPTADIQDYYNPNTGQWKDAIMRLDIKILEGHRQEAGSPEPIPLEEVKMPELPKATAGFSMPVAVAPKAGGLLRPTIAAGGKVAPKLLSLAGKLAPKIAAVKLTPAQVAAKAALIKNKGLLRPGVSKPGTFSFPKAATALAGAQGKQVAPPPKLGQGRAVAPPAKAGGKTIPVPKIKVALPSIGKAGTIRLGPLAKAARLGTAAPSSASASKLLSPTKDAGAAASGGVAGVVSSDLRAITSFVAKWGLDQTKAKLALAKLNPQKRSYVMTHFKMPATTSNGATPNSKLEQYIRQCETLNSWNSPSAKPQVAGARLATPTVARPVPAGANDLAARASAVASIRKGFAGVGAKIAAIKAQKAASPSPVASPTASSSSAKGAGAFVRTMAPKAAAAKALAAKALAARAIAPNRLATGSTGMTVRPPSASGGKGAKPIGGVSAIGQGVKRPVSVAATPSGVLQSDPKRQKIAAPSSQGSSRASGGTWKGSGSSQKGSGQYPHVVGKAAASHSVAKSWSAPFTAAKASVVAPKAKPPVTKGTLLASTLANRQSTSSWSSGSGNGSSWGSGGKATGKSATAGNTSTSWGSGGGKSTWSQGGKATSKGAGVVKTLLKKF